MPHHCHATGCDTRVPPEMLMCRRHWFMLPKPMRDAVWRTYRAGQCDDWDISHGYADAARAAVRWIAEREGRTADVSVYDMLDPVRYESESPDETINPLQERTDMPEQTKKASFAKKFGQRGQAAAAAAAQKPIEYGRRDLPPGITNGVARLVNAELQELEEKTGYKQLDGSSAKGELVLVLVAAVETPKTHFVEGTTMKVEGLQFRKYCPLFGKGAKGDFGADWSFEDCVAAARNEMGKIAGDGFDTSNFDAAVAALANANPKPRFHFSTVMGKPGTKIDPKTGKPYAPRVNVYWNGSEGLADADAPDPGGAVEDGTGADHAGANGQPFTADVDGSGEPDAAAYDWENMTLAQIAEVADSEGEPAEGSPAHEAQARLSEVVTEAGKDDAWVGQYENWAAIAAALEEEQAEPEPEPEPAPPPRKPALKPGTKPAPAPAKPATKPTPAPAKKPAAAPAKRK